MGNNIGSIAMVLFIITVMMLGLNLISSEIEGNDNLDVRSQALILDVQYESITYDSAILDASSSNITENATFTGVDPFSRQFLEDKSEVLQKKSTVDKVITSPDLFVKLIGVESNEAILAFKLLIVGLLVFFIGLMIYKAVKTGEVDG